MRSRYVLAADVGGTKTAVVLARAGASWPGIVEEKVYASQDYAAFVDVIEQFLALPKARRTARALAGACVCVAGPVEGDRAATTNLPWSGYDENADMMVVGRDTPADLDTGVRYQAASEGFIETAGMRLLSGRTFDARRDVRDAIVPGSPGYVAARLTAEVDHELLRSLILIARADLEKDDFSRIDRNDTLYHVGASALYTLNRSMVLTPSIDYSNRDSRGAQIGQRFNELRAGLSLTLRR